MRILHVLAQVPDSTGSGVYFSNLIKELKKYGHEQRAVFALQGDCTFARLDAERQFPVYFKTEALPFPIPGMSDIMPYESTRYGQMTPEMQERWATAFREKLEEASADFQPDVLILHHLWLLSSLALKQFSNARSIGLCHYTDLRQARAHPELKAQYAGNLAQLDLVLALSDSHHPEIREIHPGLKAPILTMGGGYDSTLFHPSAKKRGHGKVRILYAGKIDPAKGVYALIQAFLSLQKNERDINLSIVGNPDPEQKSRLGKLIGDNGGIRLHPALPQAQLAEAMRAHDIFVLPSFFEGLGLIAIEALACGLRTVATEIPGLASLLGREVIESGVIEFVPQPHLESSGLPNKADAQKFMLALEAKLALQIARLRRGDSFPPSVHLEIKKYSWPEIAKKINALLDN